MQIVSTSGGPMKAITIKQPWATLISEGIKEYEFRTWNTNYRGKILIHAGLSTDKKALIDMENYNLEYLNGYILAEAAIEDVIIVDKAFKEYLKEKNYIVYKNIIDSNFNGYAFKLTNIKKIIPIPAKGKLSLWNYEK